LFQWIERANSNFTHDSPNKGHTNSSAAAAVTSIPIQTHAPRTCLPAGRLCDDISAPPSESFLFA
jgi:hypothetical protein